MENDTQESVWEQEKREYYGIINEGWRLIKTYMPMMSKQPEYWDALVEDASRVASKSQFASDMVQAILKEFERKSQC